MNEVVWTAVFVAVAGIGIAIVVGRRSRAWVAAGIAYLIGAVSFQTFYVIALTGAFDPPIQFTAAEVATWFGVVGFLSLFAGTMLTLIAIGRRGRRRFLAVFAATTLAVTTHQFWTTNWAARTGTAPGRCLDTGHGFDTRTQVQRVPPGVRCSDPTGDVFVPADAICWLALAGWSLFYGFAASFPLMGLTWVVRRRPALVLPRTPL